IIVAQSTYHQILRINRTTLRRTTVSDPYAGPGPGGVGSGPTLGGLSGITMDGLGNVYGCYHGGILSLTSLSTGARTLISGAEFPSPPVGSGPAFDMDMRGGTVDGNGNVVLISIGSPGAVFRVNPT